METIFDYRLVTNRHTSSNIIFKAIKIMFSSFYLLYFEQFDSCVVNFPALHRASIPNGITVDQITICNQGRSRYVMPPVYPSLHKLNDEFIAAACSLPTSYDPTVYSNFIKDWGTVSDDKQTFHCL